MTKQLKILFFDMETTPLKAWVWQLGQQLVLHHQLDKEYDKYGVICITYCWNDDKPAKALDWDYNKQDSAKVIQQFDEIIKKADIVIGKNNTRFDNKMINGMRMLFNLPGMPEWTKYSEDLETQMRRYFRLPSYSLDYISAQLGLGGKIKMEFQDWVNICERNGKEGLSAFNKMLKYGKKDVEDTRYLWNKLSEHFDTKINTARFNDIKHGCKHCGGTNLKLNGTRTLGETKWQQYWCLSCAKYAGRAPISPIKNKIGSIK